MTNNIKQQKLWQTTTPGMEYDRVLAPVRVQRSRTKGYKTPENTVYVGRPTKFGNPFKLTSDGWILYFKPNKIDGDTWCYWSVCGGFAIEDIINLYEQWITGKLPKWLPTVPDISILKGKNLSCFCSILNKNKIYTPCHADILLSRSNNISIDEIKKRNIESLLNV